MRKPRAEATAAVDEPIRGILLIRRRDLDFGLWEPTFAFARFWRQPAKLEGSKRKGGQGDQEGDQGELAPSLELRA